MAGHETDPLRRFSDRVDDYVRYRPGYPPGLFDVLAQETGIGAGWSVADIGAGTGMLTRLLLDRGCRVAAVEPNDSMRRAADRALSGRDGFTSVAGRAEATTLPDDSADLVTAAQAFHWFEPKATRREFERILRPPGWAAVVWNTRETDATPFMRAYERLLVECAVDYTSVDHRIARERIAAFLPDPVVRRLPHRDWLELDQALGRMQSASYVPGPGHPAHAAIVSGLREIFERHAGHEPGAEASAPRRVAFVYTTEVYVGSILR